LGDFPFFFGMSCSVVVFVSEESGILSTMLLNLDPCFGNLILYLVGGLEHGFYFPFNIWDVILPTVTHSIIFQDCLIKPPTDQPVFFLRNKSEHDWVKYIDKSVWGLVHMDPR
jgi:hypothetical protein